MEHDSIKLLRKWLANMTPEEKEELKEKFKDKRPKGWVDVNEYLPMMYASDLMQGYSVYKVRDSAGKEFDSHVCDGHLWYYYTAQPLNITHWFNE